MPASDPTGWTEDERVAAAALVATPRGEVRGPFVALLRSPPLLDRSQKLGEFLRYRCSVPERLREFAICVVARLWSQAYEWHAHARLAMAAGVLPDTLEALRNGFPHPAMADDELLIFRFCVTLDRERRIDDPLYGAALELLGERGLIELIGLCGYYAMLAMVMNVARTPVDGQPFAMPQPI
ncbi:MULTISPECIES: carboxymuconolactone decarboxylase family protein [unclassified Sphingomonas]|uniref:carboxymuconolactone decarboxylase family protein n=1 Tax=unclassified Sphingomonas TaxID=196159 RepID=UPI00226A1676|nr:MULTISPECIES: carboxymuconolactone decarboxylase family protein [unclassified Sphingomonas]